MTMQDGHKLAMGKANDWKQEGAAPTIACECAHKELVSWQGLDRAYIGAQNKWSRSYDWIMPMARHSEKGGRKGQTQHAGKHE